MSREKQIEEMAKAMCGNGMSNGNCATDDEFCSLECVYGCCAKRLYNAGYRKQKEGKWVDEPNFTQKDLKGKYYVCTNCNVCVPTIEELPLYQWEFCPRCGAKMKGGAE